MKKTYHLSRFSAKEFLARVFNIVQRKAFGLVLLFLLFLSIKAYSQESTVYGMENLHISEGASVVIHNDENKITVITNSSIKSYAKNDSIAEKKQLAAQKQPLETKKQIAEKVIKKEKKIPVSAKPEIFYNNQNSSSDGSFNIANYSLKKAVNSHNYLSPFINPDRFYIYGIIHFQRLINTSYKIYLSRKEYNSLFARPPPIRA